jgi:hypothetical protein
MHSMAEKDDEELSCALKVFVTGFGVRFSELIKHGVLIVTDHDDRHSRTSKSIHRGKFVRNYHRTSLGGALIFR